MIIWFSGLSGSGKTTLSDVLKKRLEKAGCLVYQIDGDKFRKKRKARNIFSREEILNNNYQIITHCQSIKRDYDFILVSVIAPYEETRRKAREIFGKDYLEIFLDCPVEVLTKRDPKKLYAKALKKEIRNLIGFSPESPYERPRNYDLKINTSKIDIDSSLKRIESLIKKIK